MRGNRDGTRDLVAAAAGAGSAAIRPRVLDGGGRARPSRATAQRRRAAASRDGLRAEQAGGRGGGDRRAAFPGRSCARRRCTARAIARCSRCSVWRGWASRPSSATAARSFARCTAPTWRRRSGRGGHVGRHPRQDLLRLPPDVFTSARFRARGRESWAGGWRSLPVPAPVGRALLCRHRGRRAHRRPADDPHHRQGERVLSGRLDRRSRSPHP